ncbi:8134_t:CDS:2, partial [Rhizophagus irregularis]
KYKILEDFEVEQNMADTIISYLEEKYLDSIEKNIWFDTLINEYTKEERLDKAQNYVDNSALQVST